MENLTYDLIMIGVGLIVFIIRLWALHRNETLDKQAEYAQNIILTALAQTRAHDNRGDSTAGVAKFAPPDLKTLAMNLIDAEIRQNPEVKKVFNTLGITREDVDGGIETGLHAAKLGIQNVLKNGFKQNGTKMLSLSKP